MNSFNEYRKFHWGDDRTKVIRINNNSLPQQKKGSHPRYVEVGRLIGLQLVSFDTQGIQYIKQQIKHNKKPKHNLSLDINHNQINNSYLVYDNKIKNEPLFISLPKEGNKQAQLIYKKLDIQRFSIKDLIEYLTSIGFKGKQMNTEYGKKYGKIEVKPIGFVTDCLYKTFKKGHGLSNYIHAFGEPYKSREKWSMQPILGVDKKGCLWFIGGNYRCVPAGIIN